MLSFPHSCDSFAPSKSHEMATGRCFWRCLMKPLYSLHFQHCTPARWILLSAPTPVGFGDLFIADGNLNSQIGLAPHNHTHHRPTGDTHLKKHNKLPSLDFSLMCLQKSWISSLSLDEFCVVFFHLLSLPKQFCCKQLVVALFGLITHHNAHPSNSLTHRDSSICLQPSRYLSCLLHTQIVLITLKPVQSLSKSLLPSADTDLESQKLSNLSVGLLLLTLVLQPRLVWVLLSLDYARWTHSKLRCPLGVAQRLDEHCPWVFLPLAWIQCKYKFLIQDC